jgi:formamidopyrimidine-DNA glycosylase
MPELPEVETARRAAIAVAVGRRIVGVTVADDTIVFEQVSRARIRRALLGRQVRAVRRHGKHFWFELDRRPWLSVHFGMAGGLHTSRRRGVRLVSSGRRPEPGWPPRFTKLRLAFEGGHELAIADGRRLGRIRLRQDPATEPPIAGLGFDALRGLPGAARFRELARARAAPVKALLLDQSFAAGVGNWIADEVLYQARIAPRRPARSLSDRELDRLRARLRSVVRVAVGARADSDRYPRSWLFHRRWSSRPGVTARDDTIRRETIAGRTAAWVPAVQR